MSGIAHRTERVLAEPANLRVALQPIVDLETGAWVAVEALARFPDNRPPDQWFTEAHEAGIGIPLERLALERALQTLPFLPPGISLSVNASPSMVLDRGLVELMESSGAARDRLVAEVTEHAAVSGYEEIRAALLPHRERGLKLAVDDTGAGTRRSPTCCGCGPTSSSWTGRCSPTSTTTRRGARSSPRSC